jgi:hypothetical protein
MPRDNVIHLRLDDAEKERFRRVAEHHELEVAQVIRKVLREEEERLGLGPKKGRVKP